MISLLTYSGSCEQLILRWELEQTSPPSKKQQRQPCRLYSDTFGSYCQCRESRGLSDYATSVGLHLDCYTRHPANLAGLVCYGNGAEETAKEEGVSVRSLIGILDINLAH